MGLKLKHTLPVLVDRGTIAHDTGLKEVACEERVNRHY